MKINIKLEDSKYCDTCPVLLNMVPPQCKIDWRVLAIKTHVGYYKVERPEECIEKRGH